MRLKLIIGLWISLIVLASCEERADYLNWSRKVANYCKYVKYSEESKRYECGPKLGEFYTYIIVHPDYDLPKNPIYPLVAYDGNDNVVMVGGNERGQIWRMIKFEIWEFVRETKTGMKELYYHEEEKAFIGLEIGDNKENIKSMAWWSRDGGKSWVRARVPLFKKKKSNSVLSVPPVVELTPKVAPTPAGPKLPVGGIAEAVGGGYAVAIGKVGGKPAVWRSIEKVPRDWKVISGTEIKNPHAGSLPGSLKKSLPSDLKEVSFVGSDFRIEDKDGDLWISKNNGQSWDMEKFAGGDGTVGDPYKITSAIHLWLVREELDKHFKLTNDLDLSVVTEKEGFKPIGDNRKSFRGTFDGKGKLIRNLRINRPAEDYIGLFGGVGGGGVVKDIGLKDVDVRGKDKIGGLVGLNDGGTIKNSYATGNVEGVIYNFNTGGLVGSNEGTIEKSYATANVKGTNVAGGLVGNNEGTIEKSYATGKVTGSIDIGGLVGNNEGTIANSYATGSVTGSHHSIGGIVGDNYKGTIEKSYATGMVTGPRIIGGFVGNNIDSMNSIKNYWKTGSSTQGVGQGSETNIKEAELKELDATETGWDTTIWNFQAGQYPKLSWQ